MFVPFDFALKNMMSLNLCVARKITSGKDVDGARRLVEWGGGVERGGRVIIIVLKHRQKLHICERACENGEYWTLLKKLTRF